MYNVKPTGNIVTPISTKARARALFFFHLQKVYVRAKVAPFLSIS